MKEGSGNLTSLILCATEEDTSLHVFCECEALASLRYAYLGSFFLDPEGYYEYKYRGHLELQ